MWWSAVDWLTDRSARDACGPARNIITIREVCAAEERGIRVTSRRPFHSLPHYSVIPKITTCFLFFGGANGVSTCPATHSPTPTTPCPLRQAAYRHAHSCFPTTPLPLVALLHARNTRLNTHTHRQTPTHPHTHPLTPTHTPTHTRAHSHCYKVRQSYVKCQKKVYIFKKESE